MYLVASRGEQGLQVSGRGCWRGGGWRGGGGRLDGVGAREERLAEHRRRLVAQVGIRWHGQHADLDLHLFVERAGDVLDGVEDGAPEEARVVPCGGRGWPYERTRLQGRRGHARRRWIHFGERRPRRRRRGGNGEEGADLRHHLQHAVRIGQRPLELDRSRRGHPRH